MAIAAMVSLLYMSLCLAVLLPIGALGADESTPPATDSSAPAEAAAKAAEKASQASEKAADAAEKAADAAARVSEAIVQRPKTDEISSASNRMTHPFGGYASLWGDPFPTTLGLNVAYNVYDWARVNLGVGSDSADVFSLVTAGIGAKFMVPKWQLTPVLGFNLSFTKTNNAGARIVRGFDPQGTHPYGNAGLDWTTGMGLNFAVGYIIPFKAGDVGTYYLNVGVFL